MMPQLVLTGTLVAQSLNDRFTPPLEFTLDEYQLQLLPANANEENPLTPSRQGLLQYLRTIPNTIALLGLTLEVTTARWLSAIGLVLSIGTLLGFGVLFYRASKRDEVTHIRMKYGSLLVNVEGLVLQPGDRLMTVGSIDDLAKLAQKDGRMILHAPKGAHHTYFMQDTTVTYVYEVISAAAEPDVTREELQATPSSASEAAEPVITREELQATPSSAEE